jgi:hypothetical protein
MEAIIYSIIMTTILFSLFFIAMKYEQKKKGCKTFKDYLDSCSQESKERGCKHEEWNHDKQIRVIECCKCGKRAKIKDYIDLFPHK